MRSAILSVAVLATGMQACAPQPATNLNTALQGIEKARFLTCSGPPSLELAQGAGLDRISFMTNLKRGQAIGIASPVAMPAESCSGDAVFENDRLTSLHLSGNQSMCNLVFAPCLNK
jgi:hypothetical protein